MIESYPVEKNSLHQELLVRSGRRAAPPLQKSKTDFALTQDGEDEWFVCKAQRSRSDCAHSMSRSCHAGLGGIEPNLFRRNKI